MTLKRFNDDMMLRFVRGYREAACLWDTNHPNYKDKTLRTAAYQYLVDIMNIPGFTVNGVKNKIRNIRSMYCQELKKIFEHNMLGQEPYVPTNVWFAEYNEFMSANIMQRDRPSKYMMTNYQMGEYASTEDQGSSGVPCVVTSVNGDVRDFNSDISQTTDSVQDSYQTVQYSDSAVPNRMHTSVDVMLGRLERLSQSLIRQEKKQQEDEFDSFGKSVAQQMRILPLVSAMRLKIKIQTLLSEERINCLDENSKKISEQIDNDDVVVMEDEEDNKVKTENPIENVEVIMEDGDENKDKTEKLIENIEIIMDDDDDEEEEEEVKEKSNQKIENVVENFEIIIDDDDDDDEERPSSRASELSLHVSCSSSDDEDSETEH